MRKFAQNRQSSKQTDSSNTEATLILCGSSGERANIIVRYCGAPYSPGGARTSSST